MSELYDASDEVIPSVDDFDEAVNNMSERADWVEENYNTIQFALKFTKAALSGEVSAKTRAAGLSLRSEENAHDPAYPDVFTAMCAQLAKEVGNLG